VSGPLEVSDLPDAARAAPPAPRPIVEVSDARRTVVGSAPVRRALPNRARRTVGAWCFVDHFGPLQPAGPGVGRGLEIGPHPHMGLQTVTWLFDGELLHRDSIGTEQPVRPGQLNLMTAGHGVAHAEETPLRSAGRAHGMQLWVAQPSATRDGAPSFEHHSALPRVELPGAVATVLVGGFADGASPARRDTEHVGVDLLVRTGAHAVLPLDPGFEYALVIAEGATVAESHAVGPGRLLYLGEGRDELGLHSGSATRALLLGGRPFSESLFMWWNFVARTRAEIDAAYEDWTRATGRFGEVRSDLARIEADRPAWRGAAP
jgi:redox-sensitive bicupin YhaK (pirin superfamily)